MSSTDIILKFLAFLSQVRAMFRQVHLFAEQNSAVRSVSTSVIPFKGEPSAYADDGVTISIALNAELHKPNSPERKAMGVSLLLRHVRETWIAEAEIGWSGERIGWDSFDCKEAQAESVEEITNVVIPLVEWLDVRFREELSKLAVCGSSKIDPRKNEQ
jgi:hypothetical protein